MAVRDDFSAGEVLAAADLNDTFASKLPYSYGTATPSTSDSGFLWYDSNSTPPDVKFWDGSAFQALGGGTILQIVRATDGTSRSTTSTSFVDASISVTITPQKSDSAVLLIWSAVVYQNTSDEFLTIQITDNSNNAISGAEESRPFADNSQLQVPLVIIGYSTPATTSATTYKGRFKVSGGTGTIFNSSLSTGQLYAIEVSA